MPDSTNIYVTAASIRDLRSLHRPLRIFMLAALLGLPALAADGAPCCVKCGGVVVCGKEVSTICGSCITGGDSPSDSDRLNRLDITLSVGNGKPQAYKILESEGLTIRDAQSGASYLIEPKPTSGASGEVELMVKRLYSVFGLQFSLGQSLLQVSDKAQDQPAQKVGSIAIWAAEYQGQRPASVP
jgi:hypothetical protein